ncbi:MAG: GDP-mannose 4,6-dehydratase [Nanoarchaeota archaeon]|nr:GDP-mannose 4,6-dehydratase [Nanoarchaeota archaeon]
MKRALITGVTGQDGAYLSKFLLDKGYKVFGMYRRTANPNFWKLQTLNCLDKIHLIPADLSDASSILEAIRISEPDEIYNLAAQSFVEASFAQPLSTADITGLGLLRILEKVRQINPNIKVYQASTSELYGDGQKGLLNEDTPFAPSSPYASAKLFAYHTAKNYRRSYGIFVCNGILFNHESPLRSLEFVTRKITNSVAKIKLGLEKELKLGNLEAKRDWGYALDYIECMWLMLQQDEPDDYVIATGETHSVKEFAQEAFNVLGLNWEEYVKVDSKFIRPEDVMYLQGDYSKAKNKLGWEPKVKFKELVKMMVDEDYKKWQDCLAGKQFPWDAPYYVSDLNIISRTKRA